jgi:hypothetical protein
MPVAEKNSPLRRAVLAVSTFRSDEAVLGTLSKLFASGSSPFAEVIVVDSLGSGRIDAVAKERGWPIIYENSTVNLGSAGNLARRLDLAASTDADWCYAVNHDGYVDVNIVARAIARGESCDRVGAIYPLLRYVLRGDLYDAPRTELLPFTQTVQRRPSQGLLPVAWGSSNMALYSLAAVRQGTRVWGDLWMGWEDLGYGGLIAKAGWRQYLDTEETVAEGYEYHAIDFAGQRIYIANKPPFYCYYSIRNLILIDQRLQLGWRFRLSIVAKLLKEIALTVLARDHKLHRLALLLTGTFDGLRGFAGRGPVP